MVDNAPFSTPKSTTVLSAIRLDGQFACMTFEGGTTKERFKEYLETVPLPSIHEGDYVIMDNLGVKNKLCKWKYRIRLAV